MTKMGHSCCKGIVGESENSNVQLINSVIAINSQRNLDKLVTKILDHQKKRLGIWIYGDPGDVYCRHGVDECPLNVAVKYNRLDIVRLLVNLGLDVNIIQNRIDRSNDSDDEDDDFFIWQHTCLHTAIEKNNLEAAELLLELGADPEIICRLRDGRSLDAYGLSVITGNFKISRLLNQNFSHSSAELMMSSDEYYRAVQSAISSKDKEKLRDLVPLARKFEFQRLEWTLHHDYVHFPSHFLRINAELFCILILELGLRVNSSFDGNPLLRYVVSKCNSYNALDVIEALLDLGAVPITSIDDLPSVKSSVRQILQHYEDEFKKGSLSYLCKMKIRRTLRACHYKTPDFNLSLKRLPLPSSTIGYLKYPRVRIIHSNMYFK